MTRVDSPNGAARQVQRTHVEASELAARDPQYQAAMHAAGCRVLTTSTGWIAVSPAFLATLRKGQQ
jgi:hypothetical protein